MSAEFELDCEVREIGGKGASRRLRRLEDKIPAILYGGGEDPQSLSIAHKDIMHATENEAFFSHIITLNIGKSKQQAVIKDLQRHPARPFIMHADFQRVRADEEITVNVPIHFTNEEKCPGVKLNGGNVLKNITEIEISCLPKDLPEYIEVDLIALDIGDSIHLSQVTLPDGVESVDLSHGAEGDLSVCIVQAPRTEEEIEEPEAAEAAPAAEGEQAEADDKDEDGDKDEDKSSKDDD